MNKNMSDDNVALSASGYHFCLSELSGIAYCSDTYLYRTTCLKTFLILRQKCLNTNQVVAYIVRYNRCF